MITLDRPFRVLAHRGASGYAPENTFAAFDLALTMQPEAIETDLRLTRDGLVVLHHDETLDRMSDGNGPLAERTWDQIAALRVIGGNGQTSEVHRVPRLEAFLDRYLGTIPLCLEIKALGVVPLLVTELARRDAAAMGDWLELTTFEPEAGNALRAAFPELKVGMLVRDCEASTIAQVSADGYQQICPPARAITAERAKTAHAAGLEVRTWGVGNRDQLAHVIACGADGTTLNWPDWVSRAPSARSDVAAPGGWRSTQVK